MLRPEPNGHCGLWLSMRKGCLAGLLTRSIDYPFHVARLMAGILGHRTEYRLIRYRRTGGGLLHGRLIHGWAMHGWLIRRRLSKSWLVGRLVGPLPGRLPRWDLSGELRRREMGGPRISLARIGSIGWIRVSRSRLVRVRGGVRAGQRL